MAKKTRGHESKLAYQGHERADALLMVSERPRPPRATVGADRGYDSADFVLARRGLGVTPHLAQNTTNRSSAIYRRTTRHLGYEVSQRHHKRVEEVFGWLKTIGLMRKIRHRGLRRVGWMFTFAVAVYNLVRLRRLTEAPA